MPPLPDPRQDSPAAHLRRISVPHLIRLKAGALERLPLYLEREGLNRPLLLRSEGLPASARPPSSLQVTVDQEVIEASVEWLEARLPDWSQRFDCVLGLGGGKALDTAKLAAFRLGLPYFALPTSLSNDGFCSPRSSLTQGGKRTSLQARLPVGVIVDLDIVQGAPEALWLSGVGDLVAKWTAVHDWKLAFHRGGAPFDDLAALLSDASVFQFLAYPKRDRKGTRLLAQALLFNGVAMEVAGSSRPASGSEHLISHALDLCSASPRLHGLQVGLATYWMTLVQEQDTGLLDSLFERTGFWRYWKAQPMPRQEWLEALRLAPEVKPDFITVLDLPEKRALAANLLELHPILRQCLV